MAEKRGPRSARIRRRGLRARPLGDLYHFLLTTSWSRLITLITASYLAANLAFALVYWLDRTGVENMTSFHDAFFFSVQTMSTIGYGKMVPTSTLANAIVTTEAAFGLISMAMATGLMFAKFSRPAARVLFSRNVVVGRRDGVTSMMVRLANERRTGLVEASLSIVLLHDDRTAEGESVRRMHTLPLVRSQTILFSMSWTAVHAIAEGSPLFGHTAESLCAKNAEIIASVVGMDEATRETVHARYTWVADDILFGKRFADMFGEDADGTPIMDYERFHDVTEA